MCGGAFGPLLFWTIRSDSLREAGQSFPQIFEAMGRFAHTPSLSQYTAIAGFIRVMSWHG